MTARGLSWFGEAGLNIIVVRGLNGIEAKGLKVCVRRDLHQFGAMGLKRMLAKGLSGETEVGFTEIFGPDGGRAIR